MTNQEIETSYQCQSIEIPGVTHGNAPIPAGSLVGNILFSSGIAGKDPKNDELPSDPREQARFAFLNAKSLLEEVGADWKNVGRVIVYIKNDTLRDAVNEHWLDAFPDASCRPARHTKLYDLPFGMAVQLELMAVVPPKHSAEKS